jgi:DNA-binding NarL/FixJ family response regulator
MTSSKTRLRVLLADDHRLILDAVRTALESSGEFEVVGEATKGSQVLPLVARTQPDVVVLDLRMPEVDWRAVSRTPRSRRSSGSPRRPSSST